MRDPILLQVRFVQVILTSLVLGAIYWQIPFTGPTMMNVEGILYNSPRDMNYIFLFPSVYVLTSELPIVFREYRAGIYSASAYYVGKSLADIPQYTVLPIIYSTIIYWMAGLTVDAGKFAVFTLINVLSTWTAISVAYAGAAMFADEGLAQTYMPLFIWPLLVVSGFYINFDSIPPYFRWLSFISWLRYAFEGLEVNQFEDLTKIEGCTRDSWSNYTMFNDEFCPGSNGLDLLKRRDMEDATWYLNVIYIIVIMAVARLIGLGALVLRMRWSKG